MAYVHFVPGKLGFQINEKSKKFSHSNKSGTSVWIPGTVDKKTAQSTIDYINEIYEWNVIGRPLRKDIENKIVRYWHDMPKVNEFLVSLKQLPAADNKTIRDVVAVWARLNDTAESTTKDKNFACDIFEDVVGVGKSLTRISKNDVKEVFRSIATGKHSITTRVGISGRQKSNATKKKLLNSINVLLGTAFKQGFVDADLRLDARTFLGKKRNGTEEVRQKRYISVEEFEYWYDCLSHKPDYQLLITMMRFLGVRPRECFNNDRWEDLEWNDTKEYPVAINRHISKRKNKDKSIPTIRVALPKRVISEFVKYRNALKNWRENYPNLFSYKSHLRPPVFDEANNTFHGKIFCVRKDVYQITKDNIKGLGDIKAFFTCLRASASANIFDFGGAAMENKMLDHNEQTRIKHYSRSDLQGGPLADRPESFCINGRGKSFYVMYNEFIETGEDYYKDIDDGASYIEDLNKNGYSFT